MIYLDYAATAPPDPEFFDQYIEMLSSEFYNASSDYAPAHHVKLKHQDARAQIASLYDVSKDEIYFCNSATSAANIIIQGYCGWLKMCNDLRNEIIVSEVEHPAVYQLTHYLSHQGFQVRYAKMTASGQIDTSHFESQLSARTALVAIMSVNNETGSIFNIEQLSQLTKSYSSDIFFVTDFVQGIGKCKLSTLQNCDAWFFSGHKIGAPKGVACFYVNEAFRLMPILYGGGQEQGLFPGTPTPALSVSLMSCATKAITQIRESCEYVDKLRQYFLGQLKQKDIQYCLTVPSETSVPHVISITFEGTSGSNLAQALESKGILVSTRSACSSFHTDESHVIKALQVHHSHPLSPIRVSFSSRTTYQEVDRLVASLEGAL